MNYKTLLLLSILPAFLHFNIKADSISDIFGASYTSDIVSNFSGGKKQRVGYLGMANFTLELKSENLGLWKNTGFFVKASNTHGCMPSSEFIGDFQVASNIEAGNLTYLQEIWLSQQINKFELRFGLMDLNTDFLVTENGSEYLNSSFGVVPTISGNLPAPIFPLTSIGLYISYSFNENNNLKTAIFDGKPDDWDINPHNIYWSHRKNEGWMNFTEFGRKYNLLSKSGSFKIGGYFHSPYQDKNEDGNFEDIDLNYGLYFIDDQEIMNLSEGKKINAFLQIAWSPVKNNNPAFYSGLGININGINSSNENDLIGLGLAKIYFHNPYKSETVIEGFYKHYFNEKFFIQPEIQYIIKPLAESKILPDALVSLVRFGIEI